MNYNNPLFWALFAAIMLPYWRLGKNAQNRLLLVASFCFYGFWDYRFLFLILMTIAIDFIGGLGVAGIRLNRTELRRIGLLLSGSAALLTTQIDYETLRQVLLTGAWSHLSDAFAPLGHAYTTLLATAIVCWLYGAILPYLYNLPEAKRRTCFLAISMVANLTLLGFFKYFDFFASSLRELLVALGWSQPSWVTLNLILPAGISFYTFQAMSYTIDIYRRELEPTRDLGGFALFICFFPHLVAGPIMRAHQLLPQVLQPRKWQPFAFEEGFYLVFMGLFKKIVVADNLAPFVSSVFNRFQAGAASAVTGPEVAVALVAFAFQIYGDFSGYSSVARGISKWMGFDLCINFRNPYLAISPQDFWRRWHISLSSWLRDYLYLPLGGNRHGERVTARNRMLTMVLGGLWHGANWTFIAWGIFHGCLLTLFREATPSGLRASPRVVRVFQILGMFALTCLGWLLFRASSLGDAWMMTVRMFSNYQVTGYSIFWFSLICFYCLPMFVFEAIYDAEHGIERFHKGPTWIKQGVYIYLLVMLVIFSGEKSDEFIYFQF